MKPRCTAAVIRHGELRQCKRVARLGCLCRDHVRLMVREVIDREAAAKAEKQARPWWLRWLP